MKKEAGLIKVSSLTREQLTSFSRLDNGRYVLARKLQEYEWDQGSIWKLMKDPGGDLVIAREMDTKEDTESTGFGRCESCKKELSNVTVAGKNHSYCEVCSPEFKEAMTKAAAQHPITDAETPVPTGAPGKYHVQANMLHSSLLPRFQDWCDYEGFKDFTREGVMARIKVAHAQNEINDVEKNMMLASTDFFVSFAIAADGNEDIFPGESDGKAHKESTFPRVAKFLEKRPDGMSVGTFTKLFASLKSMGKETLAVEGKTDGGVENG